MMSKKQILCCLSIVGVISILIVIVFVIVQNGIEKKPVHQTEMKMDETVKPTNSENTPNAGSMPNA